MNLLYDKEWKSKNQLRPLDDWQCTLRISLEEYDKNE